ncbi:hypothetical protein AXF14_05620 [Actinomyces radicidentis]|uniref:Fimbrial protein n=1 Tax=Actinomyces radicidentis TaxID=111015 RepID=A0A0X8JEV4_ACTRD|nr:SpaH/EbpB family LPXTG-anchored major pilin [Actinomyces radicidentis]AMD87163.1 hypothetical protein AXF14_05620 [Actinomyces radicidentis]
MSSLNLRRGSSLLAAVALAVGGLAVVPGAAFAAPAPAVVAADAQVPSLVDLDTDATGSITVHKYQKTDANGTAAGNGQQATPDGAPVQGVVYKIEKLNNIDLTTQAGWEKLASYSNSVSAAVAGQGVTAAGTSQTTDGNGTATFSNLALGAYVVTEVSAPAGYTLSAPFIVTVPMTNATDTTKWDYDPDVYPKNAKTEVKKTVDDAAAHTVGDNINYTVSADIPNLPADQTLGYYTIVDQYDARMELTAGSVVVKYGDTTLADTDYTLSEITTAFDGDGNTATTNDSVKRVSVVLTDAGRKKILDARRAGTADKVTMTLTTTIKAPIAGNGIVPNTAYVLPNTPSNGWDPATSTTPPPDTPPSSTVTSKFGKVKITKTDLSSKALGGAEFQVYLCTMQDDSAITLTDNFTAGDYKLVGSPLTAYSVAADGTATATEQNTFTSAADGTVTIDALQNNDWENNATDTTPDAYCLVETKAPSGFELQTKPIAFQITADNSTADNSYTIGTTVKDVPSNGSFKLPLTGAAGVIALVLAGGLLVGGSVFLGMRNKRRNA